MTNQEINERIALITGFHNFVGLKKRGYWYRPDACGYTSRENEAGRYTIEEAQEHAHPDGDPVTIHRFTTPNYAESLDACREFEDFSTGEEWAVYINTLTEVCDMYNDPIVATPLQRCEAFLRLKGQLE